MNSTNEHEAEIARILPVGLMALGAIGLAKRPTLVGAALLGLLGYELLKDKGAAPARADRNDRQDPVERDSEDSFPASDPPGWSGATAKAS